MRLVDAVIRRLAVAVIVLGSLCFAAPNVSSAPRAPSTANRCVSRAGLPDPRCTPGAVNPAVRQSTIGRTICIPNWTDTVRPPTSYTNRLKVRGISAYGFADRTLGDFEEDHLIPLAVGGSPRSPKNLWPERYGGRWGARVKDKLERYPHDRVCDGSVRCPRLARVLSIGKPLFDVTTCEWDAGCVRDKHLAPKAKGNDL